MQWRGVPYGAAPVGARRFRAPAPRLPWDGVRDASRFGSAAPQAVSSLQGLVGGTPGAWNEDCLYLNVFAPAHEGDPLPVMVWIHGGAFIGGSGSARWYDGGRFAAEGGVVVVTLNYRVGVLGFLELGGVAGDRYPDSGNCGILDQLAALRWVQDNIGAFGGDPTRVTVFGESAGAMSIGVMLAMPAARGLFQAAILQSGAASAYRTRDEADGTTEKLLSAFGGSLEELLAAPAERIIEAQTAVVGRYDAAGHLAFQPVVDGVNIPDPPDQAIAAGAGGGIPVMIGTNRDETTLFLAFHRPIEDLSEERLDRRLSAVVGASRWHQLKDRYPSGDSAGVLVAVTTDLLFRIPAIGLAESLAKHDAAAVWMYRFDWPSPAAGGRLGATHALDLPFVWDLLDVPGVELFTGEAPGRHELARAMHAAWLAFATAGDPATALLPEWPRYQAPARATMLFDGECRVANDPNGAERHLWDSVN